MVSDIQIYSAYRALKLREMFLLKECLALPFSTTSFKEIHIFDLD